MRTRHRVAPVLGLLLAACAADPATTGIATSTPFLTTTAPGSSAVYVSSAGAGPPERWSDTFTQDTGGWRSDRHPRQLADLNGDGRQDVVGFGENGVLVALSTGSGFAPAAMWLDDFGASAGWRLDQHPRTLADLNGDGRADVIGFGENAVMVALSTGTGLGAAQAWSWELGVSSGWRVDRHPRLLADMNGDGRADVIGFGENAVMVALSTGTGLSAAQAWSWEFGVSSGWRMDRHPRTLADVDGDGRADVVGFGEYGVIVARSTGTGLEPAEVWNNNFGVSSGWRIEQHPRYLADVDSDGRADVVGFGEHGVAVARSTGTGFAEPSTWLDDFCTSRGWQGGRHPRLLADLDGDGKQDLVGFGEHAVITARSTGTGFTSAVAQVFEYGYSGGWRDGRDLRLLGDVDGDGSADVVAFGVATSLYSQRRLDQLTWLAAHNAFANADDAPWSVVNQSHGLRWQLDQGVRALMLDVHHWDPPGWLCAISFGQVCPPPGAYLCHGGCNSFLQLGQAFAPQPVTGGLVTIRDFLVDHPDQLVTVFIEDYASAGDWDAVLSEVPGLAELVFDPEAPEWSVKQRGWPTVGALVAANRRLLVFTDSPDHDDLHGLQYDEQYTVQNTWSIGQDGSDYACRSRWGDVLPLDRSEGGFERLFLMSHFRDVPTTGNAGHDNGYANLERRVYEDCLPAAGRLPHFVSVDFFDSAAGAPQAIVDHLNATR